MNPARHFLSGDLPNPFSGAMPQGAVESAAKSSGRYDHGLRRRAKRSQRERGCWTYIAAEELQRAGFDPPEAATHYRTWGSRGGSVLVRLYREA